MNTRLRVAATIAFMLAAATTHAQTGKALAALAQDPMRGLSVSTIGIDSLFWLVVLKRPV